MGRRRIVVKVGGSLAADQARLRVLLARFADLAGDLVIVPGGGIFADAVRTAQDRLAFDDALAHRLALDAMGGMAEVFAALEPRLRIATSIAGLEAAWREAALPVWDPVALRAGHPDIPESWGVTSDSLALWLATQIGAAQCVLVKSADAPPESGLQTWVASGLVDTALPVFAARYAGDILIHGPASGDLGVLFGPDIAQAGASAAHPGIA